MKKGKIKVICAMSGGVDSSVAAALLKQQGYSVAGVFMKFWKEPNDKGGFNRCCSPDSERRARLVARILKIPFYVFNFEKEFKKRVVNYFIKGYKEGITPNPCVVCNKEIKFGLLMEKALGLGADFIATGHYARVFPTEKHNKFLQRRNFCSALGVAVPSLRSGHHAGNASERFSSENTLALAKGEDKDKDQSYFLWQLGQKQLKRVLFPVGGYTKPEVRKLAEKFKLPFKKIPESMEICFVPDKLEDFLKKYIKTEPGPIYLTPDIKRRKRRVLLGQHRGLPFYTIGQRKGIELSGGPFYVVGKDTKKNALIVVSILKDKELWSKTAVVKGVNWISGKVPKLPLKVQAQIRYRHPLVPAVISKVLNPKTYALKFQNPQRAVTPGQSAVFYLPRRSSRGAKAGIADELVGGGIIC